MLITAKVRTQYPMSIEREYSRALVRYVKRIEKICIKHIPQMVDAILLNAIRFDDWIEEQTEDIEGEITKEEEAAIIALILAMFNRTRIFNERQEEKIFTSIFGATPTAKVSPQVYNKIREMWVNQNLTLIHSIDRRIMEAIHYTLSRNAVLTVENRKKLVDELTETIKEMGKINEKRAVLIATDQVGKLNSQLVQYEQMKNGVKGYLWQSMRDDRVREMHKEYDRQSRDGKVFSWDKPPEGGHPGWAIRCRCVAKPIFDGEKIGLKPLKNSFIKLPGNDIISAGEMMASEKFTMPLAKIKDFLLKPGAKHSQEFFDVGYTPNDAERLNLDIEELFDEEKATDKKVFPDGMQRFSIFMDLGVNIKKRFRTVWQRDNKNDKPRFVTAHRE